MRRLLPALAAAVLATACSASTPRAAAPTAPAPSTRPPVVATPTVAPSRAATASAPVTGGAGTTAATRPTKVLVVVLENHAAGEALSRMPYLDGLAGRYGYASSYYGVTHPSLPNYLAIAGGSTFGVHDDSGPSSHPLGGASVFGQALAAGRTARTYAEAMPSPCFASSTSRYAVKHDPWAYFTAERTACRRFDVPAGTASSGAFAQDVRAGALPTVGLLVPDICHDGHDCSLATTDGWLRQWLGPVLAGPDFRTGRLAVVVTFDEDDHSAGNRVLTVVADVALHGVVVGRRLDHLSLSRWLSQLSGSPGLRQAAGATSLGTAFGLAR